MKKLTYLIVLVLALLTLGVKGQVSNAVICTEDSLILEAIIAKAQQNNWADKSLNEIIVEVAEHFIGTPYVGGVLDRNSEEQLVVNFRELDCVTLVENVLALSICIKRHKTSPEDFVKGLQYIRYRNGKLDGYASRLHYFSEWLVDNQQKGLMQLASQQFASMGYDNRVNIMSKNASKNRHLQSASVLDSIKQAEEYISLYQLKYLPKQEVNNYRQNIYSGDILALTTSINGLDVVHVGFAYFKGEELYLLHASSLQKNVVVSKVPLFDFLNNSKRYTGILVARGVFN